MRKIALLLPWLIALLTAACDSHTNASPSSVITIPVLSDSITGVHAHDTSFFTEGLEFYKGTLLESTGLKGQSRLVQQEFPGGRIIKQVSLDTNLFGEGITVLRDTLYQLTYQEHVVNVYSLKDFKKIKQYRMDTEGWGLTNDGHHLIASDGSSNLYYYDPGNFRLMKTQTITESGAPAINLNELEYANGFIYANQWQYNYIVKIDQASGKVVAKMDLSELVTKVKAKYPAAEVLNGIAYNPETKKVYVTGKYWPDLYELKATF